MTRPYFAMAICLMIAVLAILFVWLGNTVSPQGASSLHTATVSELVEYVAHSNDSALREKAIAEYARREPPPSTTPIADLLRYDDAINIRATAAAALGRMYAYDEVESLLDALDDPSQSVRQRAYESLSSIWGQHVSGYRGAAPRPQRLKEIEVLREAWPHKKAFVIEYHTKKRFNRHTE